VRHLAFKQVVVAGFGRLRIFRWRRDEIQYRAKVIGRIDGVCVMRRSWATVGCRTIAVMVPRGDPKKMK
jgi:hypothetical protein